MATPPPRFWTLPNLFSLARGVGSVGLALVATAGWRHGVLGLFVLLLATDWLDGRLARWLNQRSSIGPRLDTAADFSLHAATLYSLWRLRPEALGEEAVWIGAAVASYLAPLAITLFRFRRPPSFHTRMAKMSWGLTGVAAIVLFAGGPAWPVRVAMGAAVLTNLEAAAIAARLKTHREDVSSIFELRSPANGMD